MSVLREVLQEAEKKRVAIGHFNFSELVVLKAAAEAAGELRVPVVMGVSESEREFLGVKQAAALIRSFREETGQKIFLNADHTHSLEKAEEAARAGFDMGVPFNELNRAFDLGFKPLPWGDRGYVPGAMQPADGAGVQGPNPGVAGAAGRPVRDPFTRLAAALTTNGSHQ